MSPASRNGATGTRDGATDRRVRVARPGTTRDTVQRPWLSGDTLRTACRSHRPTRATWWRPAVAPVAQRAIGSTVTSDTRLAHVTFARDRVQPVHCQIALSVTHRQMGDSWARTVERSIDEDGGCILMPDEEKTLADALLGGVLPTTSVVSAFQAVAGSISLSLCGGVAFQSIAEQLEEMADIQSSGSNVAGQPCTAMSLGLQFTGSSPFDGGFPVPGPKPLR